MRQFKRKVGEIVPELTEADWHKKFRLKPATVLENRLPIFAPMNKTPALAKNMRIETGYGSVALVGGILTQMHKDLLEIMRREADKVVETKDGRLGVIVDMHKLRTAFGKNTRGGYKTIAKLLDEMMQVTIEVEVVKQSGKQKVSIKGRFLDLVVTNKYEEKPRKKASLLIMFGYLGTKLFWESLWLNYDVETIRQLKHGVSKAVARHILSHKNPPKGGWHLETILKNVGLQTSEQLKKAKFLLKEDTELLKKLGIEITDGRILYSKNAKQEQEPNGNLLQTSPNENSLQPLKKTAYLPSYQSPAIVKKNSLNH